jgi:hypothetical protein
VQSEVGAAAQMILHPLSPEMKCQTCGGELEFVRVRRLADLYQCAGAKACAGRLALSKGQDHYVRLGSRHGNGIPRHVERKRRPGSGEGGVILHKGAQRVRRRHEKIASVRPRMRRRQCAGPAQGASISLISDRKNLFWTRVIKHRRSTIDYRGGGTENSMTPIRSVA